jgi:membrane protease YdiL (CAAX protease family)
MDQAKEPSTSRGTAGRAVGLTVLVWIGFLIWWHVCIRLNAFLAPSIPIAVLLAFGALIAFRKRLVYVPADVVNRRMAHRRTSIVLSGFLAISVCLLAVLTCFAFSNSYAAIPLPEPSLRGFAAVSASFALSSYVAIVEEAAYRGQLQTRLEPLLGRFGSAGVSSFLFVFLHFSNREFSEYWPLYVAISVTCGLLVACFGSISVAILVHFGSNLAATLSADALNQWTGFFSQPFAQKFLVCALLLAAAIFCLHAWRARANAASPS